MYDPWGAPTDTQLRHIQSQYAKSRFEHATAHKDKH
jgi:hypothetical protein